MADGQALLAVFDTETDAHKLRETFEDVLQRLQPLLALSEQCSADAVRPVARLHGPLVMSMVKAISNWLSPKASHSHERLAVLGEAACLALNALDRLRPLIKASRHELEVQRYKTARKLAALGLHRQAMAMGKVLHASTSCGPGSAVGPGDLHIGAVANLLICYAELVQVDSADAQALWDEVHGPVCGLLHSAREAADLLEAGKRLEPVLECLGKVVETLQLATVISHLSPTAVAQQLDAFLACGKMCRQEQAVQQMLLDDTLAAPQEVQMGLVDAMLDRLSAEGTLPDELCAVLHQLAVNLVQKHAQLATPCPDGDSGKSPLPVVVRCALAIPGCMLQHRNTQQLSDVLSVLAAAVKRLQRHSDVDQSSGSAWQRWCCLDVLQAATSSVYTQLISTPQAAGGKLTAVAQCLEVLCADGLHLARSKDTSFSAEALQSGCKAAVMAARLQGAHCLCTGQLAGLHDDMSRVLGVLQQLLQLSERLSGRCDQAGLSQTVLQSLSASLGNLGVDLLRAQVALPAVDVLKVAAELAFRRVDQPQERSGAGRSAATQAGADVPQLVRKCKAHITALQQASNHTEAMDVAASYVIRLQPSAGEDVQLLTPLVKLYVRSSVAAADAIPLDAPGGTVPAVPSAPSASSSAAPAAPCKGQRRGGRLRRLKADDTPPLDAEQQACPPAAAATSTQPPPPAVVVPRTLLQSLAASAASGSSSFANCLDVYAVQELDALAKDSRTHAGAAVLQQSYTAAVMGSLVSASERQSCPSAKGRALLVRAVIAPADLARQVADLQDSLRLLDPAWPSCSTGPSNAQGCKGLPQAGLVDSAALAHAQMGACLVQQQLAQGSCTDIRDAALHVGRALALWEHLLRSRSGSRLALRMPQATLHAALQVYQFANLYADSSEGVLGSCVETLRHLVGALSHQVKPREQDVYMLCAARLGAGCAVWALAAPPCPTLAEAAAAAASDQQPCKLGELLKVIRPVQDAYTADCSDHVAVARAADASASEMEHGGFLRHGPGPLLLRSQCHHMAAAGHLRAGDTAAAYVHAQEALRITCSLFASLGCRDPGRQSGSSPSRTGAADQLSGARDELDPAAAAAAAVKSGAEASAHDYAVDETEVEDDLAAAACNPEPSAGAAGASSGVGLTTSESSRGRSSVGSCFALFVAAAHIASLHQAARVFEAAGCVEDATCVWKECGRAADIFNVPVVKALCGVFLSELSCRRGDAAAAQDHAAAASAAMAAVSDHTIRQGQHPDATAACLQGHLSAARARLHLLQADPGAAQQACEHGLALAAGCGALLLEDDPGQLQTHAGGARCPAVETTRSSGVLGWYGACVRSQLQRLRAEALLRLGRRAEAVSVLQDAVSQLAGAAARCERDAAAVWPIDYGLLLAHQAAAAMGVAGDGSPGGGVTVVGVGSRQHPNLLASKGCNASGTGSAASDLSDGGQQTDQMSKKGSKSKVGGVRSKPMSSNPGVGAGPATAASGLLVNFLQSMQLCWQVPLAAAHACRQLTRVCIAHGLPHAASTFLHLGTGMSYAQHQALQQHLRQRRERKPPSASSAESCGSDETSTSSAMAGVVQGMECDVQTVRGTTEPDGDLVRGRAPWFLSELVALGVDGGDGGGNLLAALEERAEAWQGQVLSKLPTGAVVSSIAQDEEGGQLLLGRIAYGRAPLLVSLRASSTAGAPASGDGGGRQSQPRGGLAVVAGCVSKLQSLLDESGSSMKMDQDAGHAQGHKAKWWKARTDLDQRVHDLVLELEQQSLGPWRCLLLPVPPTHREALSSAAEAFLQEHLPLIGDAAEQSPSGPDNHPPPPSSGRLVLRELLTVVLAHMQHLKAPEVAVLLGSVCGQLAGPTDTAQLSSLALKLTAAEAAVRVELLRIQSSDSAAANRATGPACGDEESAAGAAAPVDVGTAVRARGARACAAAGLGSRSRPDAARAQPLPAAATRLGAAAAGRRAAGLAIVADDEDGKALAASGPAGRSTRATRAALQQLPGPASLPGPSGPAPRINSTRGAARGQAAPPEAPPKPPPRPAAGLVLLTLSPQLHSLPWESMPCCQGHEVYRILSLTVAVTAGARSSASEACAISCSGAATSTTSSPADPPTQCSLPSAFYVLNPSGDLMDTQRFFQPLLEAQPNWKGLVGVRPDVRTLLDALQACDVFLYFGHGSGEQFLPLPVLRKLRRCAASLLMGCSSGRLRLHGAYDPTGPAVAYILAGCSGLVVNLWDITDRDIDRYCQALMQAWLGCGAASEADGSSSGGGGASEASLAGGCETLGMAAARSRDACKLRHLTGAAPVCYGLPPALSGC